MGNSNVDNVFCLGIWIALYLFRHLSDSNNYYEQINRSLSLNLELFHFAVFLRRNADCFCEKS